MESTIVDGAWRGHLGRGLALRELQFVMAVAQGLTAKETGRAFGIAACTVHKSLQRAMFKLCVHRQGAMIAEAMRRQIITPLCLMLIAVMAVQGLDESGLARRDRRPSERRGGELRLVRRADSFDLVS
ncbi:helix-turn-helix transcriptional regulator [Pseudomonas helleri]|uniref:helix-turn-helix transcriptional regulator n=1 Tax=Pseudomonas helleri TaxID=1608996 RepID=UPI003FD0586C